MSYFPELYTVADCKGKYAASKCVPVPMVVSGPVDLNDKPLPGYFKEFVADGVCGFAWVTVRPGNCPFANWLKKNKLGENAYGGGVQIWIRDYNQCMQKKEAYAEAFAAQLREYGISAYAGSRLD